MPVGAIPASLGHLPDEADDEDANYPIVTGAYDLLPESMGGPAIPAKSLVELAGASRLEGWTFCQRAGQFDDAMEFWL